MSQSTCDRRCTENLQVSDDEPTELSGLGYATGMPSFGAALCRNTCSREHTPGSMDRTALELVAKQRWTAVRLPSRTSLRKRAMPAG